MSKDIQPEKEHRFRHVALPIVIGILSLAIGGFGGYAIARVFNGLSAEEQKLVDEYRILMDEWVFADQDIGLSDAAMEGIAQAIAASNGDSFTFYTPTAEEQNLSTSHLGFGFTSHTYDGGLYLVDVHNGEAQKAGLEKGDVLYGVKRGNEAYFDFTTHTNAEVNAYLGEEGHDNDTFVFDYVRNGLSGQVSMKKGTYRENIVEILQEPSLENKNTLAIRIPSFLDTVSKSVNNLLRKYALQEKTIDRLIIDLRGNGGGALNECEDLAKLFVKKGTLIYELHGKDDAVLERCIQYSDPTYRIPSYDIILDGNSASASEIVASALQDYGRAIVVGDSKSHGKGTVQTVMGLGDNTIYGADRITSACFYRINGGTTQLRGVIPDIVLPSIYDALELGEDQLPGALPYSEVAPAYYAKTADVAPFLPRLKAASDKRLAADKQYQAAQRLIAHVRKANAEQSVPLNIDKRRARMRAERTMQKLQDEALRGGSAKARKDGPTTENDPVLRESFRILSDYIDLRGGPDEPVNTDGDLGMRLFRIFGAQ